MTFTAKRFAACAACGEKLPAGSRIDRRYCSTACIERAYYQRHPDKKRTFGSHRRKTDVAASPVRPQDAMGSRATRVDSSHIELRQQRTAAQERIAKMEKELQSVAAPTLPDNTQAHALEQAHQQIVELQKQLRAANGQVASTQTELAELRAWGQQASEMQGVIEDKLKRANKKIAELEAERAADCSRAAARFPIQPSQTRQYVPASDPGNRRPQVATDPSPSTASAAEFKPAASLAAVIAPVREHRECSSCPLPMGTLLSANGLAAGSQLD